MRGINSKFGAFQKLYAVWLPCISHESSPEGGSGWLGGSPKRGSEICKFGRIFQRKISICMKNRAKTSEFFICV